MQEGVAPCKPGHKNRQLWKWTGIKQQPSPKSVELLGELILNDEEKFDELDWKTYFMRDPSTLDEPIATSDASAGRPPPEPLTQEEMREKFDLARMVKWHGGQNMEPENSASGASKSCLPSSESSLST